MDPILIAAVVLVALVALFGLFKGKTRTFPYEKAGPVLTRAEQKFFKVLVRSLPPGHTVMPKIRVADIIKVKASVKRDAPSDRSAFWKAFGQISQKHVDFALVETKSFTVVAAIELDDASHRQRAARTNDEVKNKAFAAAGLPLLRFTTQPRYEVNDLANAIIQGIDPKPQSDPPLGAASA